jgi:hypothetical protein
MKVKAKRNKPFTCDECGKEVDTEKEYRKVILLRCSEGHKNRNKFCSIQCFDTWNLVNKQEDLEDNIGVEVYDREDEVEEEEPYVAGIRDESEEEPKVQAYVNGGMPAAYYAEPEPDAQPQKFDQAAEKDDDASDLNKVKAGYVYEKAQAGRKLMRMTPRSALEKLRDRFKAWGILYDRDDWK